MANPHHIAQAALLVSAIYNAAWWVRHYCRPRQEELRARAVRELGLACRRAFNECEDFEPLLEAILDALAPPGPRRRF